MSSLFKVRVGGRCTSYVCVCVCVYVMLPAVLLLLCPA